MNPSITITKDTFSLSFRLPFLLVGMLFFSFGIFATAKVVLALFDIALGRAFEGYFMLGVAIALGFTLLGAAGIWTFFIPKEVIVFDGLAGTVTSERRYPFGLARRKSFDLAKMTAPEVVWLKDHDRTDGGYWALKLMLPDGRKVTCPQDANFRADEKMAAEGQRDSILKLMGWTND